MAKENEEEIQGELYSGADFDTIEVPEEAKTILADQDEAHEQKEKKSEASDEANNEQHQEAREDRQQRKRNYYQKRLNELTREKHEEREARAAAEAKAELLEQRLRDMEKAGTESTNSILKQREQDLVERRRIAEDAGDLKSYSEASDELFKVRGKMRESVAEENPTPKKIAPPSMAPEAAAWLESNPWFEDPANDHLAAEVERIENDLIRRGYNLNNPEQAKRLYVEIDRRIRQRPEFDSVLGDGGDEEEQEQQEHKESEKKPTPRSHIAPPSRGGEAPERKKAGELTQHDIRAIKTFGLDPSDPKVRAAYLKRKRA